MPPAKTFFSAKALRGLGVETKKGRWLTAAQLIELARKQQEETPVIGPAISTRGISTAVKTTGRKREIEARINDFRFTVPDEGAAIILRIGADGDIQQFLSGTKPYVVTAAGQVIDMQKGKRYSFDEKTRGIGIDGLADYERDQILRSLQEAQRRHDVMSQYANRIEEWIKTMPTELKPDCEYCD